jgi:hypothetical protein
MFHPELAEAFFGLIQPNPRCGLGFEDEEENEDDATPDRAEKGS